MKKLVLLLMFITGQMVIGQMAFAQVEAISTTGSGYGTYTNLKDAFTAINDGVLAGNIEITITGSTIEPDSATLNASGTGAAVYSSVIIKPSGGAWTISGNVAGPLINLNGADNITIDGLNTNGDSLIISNASTSSVNGTSTIRFTNDATGNTIRNSTLLGSSTTPASGGLGGVVFFGTAVNVGNDNNTISQCDIGSVGSFTPTKAIASIGTLNSAAKMNSGISILNCTIHDYFAAGATSAGIYLSNGNIDWVIDGNKFYQSSLRTQTGNTLTHSAIHAAGSNTNSNSNLQILNNTIGYATADGTGMYSYATTSGAASSQLIGINLVNIGTTTPASIQGNAITNIAISGAATGTPFVGMYLGTSFVNIGNITPNTIGSLSVNGAITGTSSATSTGEYIGIQMAMSSLTQTVANNKIGGITVSNTSTGAANITGIKGPGSAGPTLVITDNIIGGTSANSLLSNSTANGTTVIGISNGVSSTISGNTIRNLTAAGGNGTSSVQGISLSSSSAQTVRQNTIYGLTNTHASVNTTVSGVVSGGTGSNTIDGNIIHSLDNRSSAGTIQGILVSGGTVTAANNMIRLGIDTSGAPITKGITIYGINETGGTNNVYHNSIYIGGTGVLGSANTFAFSSTVATGNRNYINNIFVNVRSNGAGTGKHYAVRVGGTTVNPTGLSMKNNIFLIDTSSTSGGMLGMFNGVGIANLYGWQAAVGGNTGSGFGDPMFVEPTGSTATVDLHIHPTAETPVEGFGATVSGITKDVDGHIRNGSTPDIGADEGTFVSKDIYIPILGLSKLSNDIVTSTTRYVADVATVTDPAGIDVNPGTKPRLYYKKTTNNNAYLGNSSSDNGWKYVEATNATSPYSFDIDYSILYGGGLSVSDSIQYFVVAQDMATTPNVGIYPGIPSVSPTSVDLEDKHFPIKGSLNVYRIIGEPMNGTFMVGTTQTYPTISAALADLNTRGVDGPVTLQLTDNSYTSATETFPLTFGVVSGVSATNTITLQPTVPNTVIKGSNLTAIIDLNGARYVTIEGRIDPSGNTKDLTIENTLTNDTSTLRFKNDASDNTIQYCVIKGSSDKTSTGTVMFSTTTGITGNDNNIIDNCDIKNSSSRPLNGVFSLGSTTNAAVYNDNNIVRNCNVFNFAPPTTAVVASAGIRLDGGNAGWQITGNSLYDTASLTFTATSQNQYGILINVTTASTGFVVSNNVIGGSMPNASGTPFTLTTTAATTGTVYTAIGVSSGIAPSTIQNNTITNMKVTAKSSALNAFQGINVDRGYMIIEGNTIGSTTNPTSIDFTATAQGGGLVGIRAVSTITTAGINNNTVSGIDVKNVSQSNTSHFTGIMALGGTSIDITNNTIGSTTLVNSINASTPSLDVQPQFVRGIWMNTGTATTGTITGNTIANMNTNTVSTGNVGNVLVGIVYTPTGASTTPIVISNNKIHHLTSSSLTTTSGASAALGGIYVTSTAGGTATLSDNKIFALKLTGVGATGATHIRGIYYAGTGTANAIFNNSIHNFSVDGDNTSAIVTGIFAGSGTSKYYNNFVQLGVNADGEDENTGYSINAIYDSAGTNSYYYNSVYVGGLAVSNGTANTYAFTSGVTGKTRSFINNSFYNARSNAGGSGTHYAVRVSGAGVDPAGLSMNNNLMYVNGVGGVFGYYGQDIIDLNQWITEVGQNTASIAVDPLYTNATGTINDVDLAPQTASPLINSGVPVSGITTDMLGTIRNPSTPTIGAGESNAPLPVKLVSFTGKKTTKGVELTWVTASEFNNDYFNVQRSVDGTNFTTITRVKGRGTTSATSTYTFTDAEAIRTTQVYYRLVQVDFDRNQDLSKVIVINASEGPASVSFSVVPNPFVSEVGLVVNSDQQVKATVRVIDMSGHQVLAKSVELTIGENHIALDELVMASTKGVYIIQVITPTGVFTQKAIRQN